MGTGEIPLKGHKVRIAYTIHTPNGSIIDSEDPSMKKILPWKRTVAIVSWIGFCYSEYDNAITIKCSDERRRRKENCNSS